MGGWPGSSPAPCSSPGIEGAEPYPSGALFLLEYVVFHPWRSAIIVVAGITLGAVGFYGYQLGSALDAMAMEDFDPSAARAAISESTAEPSAGPVDPGSGFGDPIDDSDFESYLLIATHDGQPEAIVLALQPEDGSHPLMVSLPPDLYLWNACRQARTELGAGLDGCRGEASGPELLAIMTEGYTGVPVDHLAMMDFDDLPPIVDALGGMTFCVDHPTRDPKSGLELPEPGCQHLGGDAALAWVRSEEPRQLVDGVWLEVGASDIAHQRRHEDILMEVAARIGSPASPAALATRLQAVSSVVTLDGSWTLAEAVATAWRYRGLTRDDIRRFSIQTSSHSTPDGAVVLLPAEPFVVQLVAAGSS